MAWVKIDDSLPDHPKLTGLTDAGCWLYVVALCYANRHLTDGYVPDTALTGRQRRHANQLETAGLLTRAPDDHGWLIHDYLAYQPSRAEVENRRKIWRDAGKKGAQTRWGTPSETDGV